MATVHKFILSVVILCCVFEVALCEDNSDSSTDVSEGRTFGSHLMKRISFALIPGAFVIGVVTTLLAALTIVSMKGLGIGVILLILAIGQMLGRLLPPLQPAAYASYAAPHAAPVPIVYSHSHSQQPVYLEKEW